MGIRGGEWRAATHGRDPSRQRNVPDLTGFRMEDGDLAAGSVPGCEFEKFAESASRVQCTAGQGAQEIPLAIGGGLSLPPHLAIRRLGYQHAVPPIQFSCREVRDTPVAQLRYSSRRTVP